MDAAVNSTTDWISAWANVALVLIAAVGFAVTIYTLAQGRNRQRIEVEGYIRVDVGPPEGASGFVAP